MGGNKIDLGLCARQWVLPAERPQDEGESASLKADVSHAASQAGFPGSARREAKAAETQVEAFKRDQKNEVRDTLAATTVAEQELKDFRAAVLDEREAANQLDIQQTSDTNRKDPGPKKPSLEST